MADEVAAKIPSRISESTLLPVSLIIMIMGFVWQISSVSFQTTANAKELENQKLDYKLYVSNLIIMQQDIATIKGSLEVMKRSRK